MEHGDARQEQQQHQHDPGAHLADNAAQADGDGAGEQTAALAQLAHGVQGGHLPGEIDLAEEHVEQRAAEHRKEDRADKAQACGFLAPEGQHDGAGHQAEGHDVITQAEQAQQQVPEEVQEQRVDRDEAQERKQGQQQADDGARLTAAGAADRRSGAWHGLSALPRRRLAGGRGRPARRRGGFAPPGRRFTAPGRGPGAGGLTLRRAGRGSPRPGLGAGFRCAPFGSGHVKILLCIGRSISPSAVWRRWR